MPVVGGPGSNTRYNPFRRAAMAPGRIFASGAASAPREEGDPGYGDRFATPTESFDWASLRPLVEAYNRQQEFQRRSDTIKAHATQLKTFNLDPRIKQGFQKYSGNVLAREMKSRDQYISDRAPNAKAIIDEYRHRADSLRKSGIEGAPQYEQAANQYDSQARLAFTELFGTEQDRYRLAQTRKDLVEGQGTFQTNLASAKQELEKNKAATEPEGGSWWQTALEWAGKPLEEAAMQPYYAGLATRNAGYGPLASFNSAFQNLWGVGVLGNQDPDSVAAKAGRLTETHEKRAALAQAGMLDSFGQEAARSPLANAAVGSTLGVVGAFTSFDVNRQIEEGSRRPQVLGRDLSAGYDAFFNIAGDPLTYTPLILGKAGRVGSVSGWLGRSTVAGEVAEGAGAGFLGRTAARVAPTSFLGKYAPDLASGATQAGREGFLATRVGKSVLSGSEKALANAKDGSQLSKMLGIPEDIAKSAVAARDAGGVAKGQEILRAAFVSADFSPTVTLRRQLAARLGIRGAVGGRGYPVVLGNKAFKVKPGLVSRGLREMARGDGAEILLNKAGRATDGIVSRAPKYGTNRKVANVGDYWQKVIRPEVETLSNDERFTRLLSGSVDPAFRSEVDDTIRRFEHAAPARQAEELRKLEFIQAVAEGKLGPRAQLMAQIELAAKAPASASPFAPGTNKPLWNRVVKAAAADVGLDRSAELSEHIQAGLAQAPVFERYKSEYTRQIAELKKQLPAAGPDAKVRIEGQIASLEQQVAPLDLRLKQLKKEVTQAKADSNPFHRPDAAEAKKVGLGKPRTPKEIHGDIANLEKVLIPERRRELQAAIDGLRAEELATASREVAAIEQAIRVNKGTLKDLRGRATKPTDVGLGYNRGAQRTTKATRNIRLQERMEQLRQEIDTFFEMKKDLKGKIADISRGTFKTPEIANLEAELRVLSAATDHAPIIQRAKNAVHSAETALGTITRSIDTVTEWVDDAVRQVDVSPDQWQKAGYKKYLARVDKELVNIRRTLKAYLRDDHELATRLREFVTVDGEPVHIKPDSATFDRARRLEAMTATERRVVQRLVDGIPEDAADDVVLRLSELKLAREEAANFLADQQKALDNLVRQAEFPTGAPVLRPLPLADWEMSALVKRTGLTEDAIRKAEGLTEQEIADQLDVAQRQMEKFNTSRHINEFDPQSGYDLASGAQKLQADVADTAQRIVLYSEMLGRTAERTHPLLDRLNATRWEADHLVQQVGAVGEAGIDAKLDARLARALRTVGVGDGKALANTPVNRSFLKMRANIIDNPELRALALEELERLGKKDVKSLSRFGAQLESVLANEALRTQSVNLLNMWQNTASAHGFLHGISKRGGFLRTVGRVAELPLSAIESVAPTHIRWTSSSNDLINMRNLGEDVERWAAATGFDENTVFQMREAALATKTEDELIGLLKDAYSTFAEQRGIPVSAILDPGDARFVQTGERITGLGDLTTKQTRRGKTKVLDAETTSAVQLVTQRVNAIPVLEPSEMWKLAREYRSANGAFFEKAGAKARIGLGAANFNIPLTGGKLTTGEVAAKTHRFWKFSVVTNAPTIALGAVGGFATGDSLDDRLHRAAMFGGIGLLGSVRYLGRVVGVEERLVRYTLIRGMNPIEFIPGVAKWARRAGLELPFTQGDELASGANPLHHYEGKTLITKGEGWVVLDQTDARFIDGWYRIANFQIHPETDDLARMALQGNLGLLGNDWKVLAKQYLTMEDDGKILLKRLQGAVGGPKNADEAILRYAHAIDTYLPSEDMQRLRLAAADNPQGRLSHDELRSFLKDGDAPPAVYAEDSWYVPSPLSVAKWDKTWRTVYGRSVLEAPTAKINRIPLAESIYGDEFRRLRTAGMTPERAQMVAEDIAVQRTNQVMFRISDESRFAAKADFIFPFQQPREELVRVYTKLVVDNKARVAQWTRNAATMFNNGVEGGAFFEDDRGEWRMRIPGSAYLSEVFGSPAQDFDFRLRDAFFFLQGAGAGGGAQDESDKAMSLAQGVLPVPGGPFWTQAAKLTLNAHPWIQDQFEDTWVWKRMFPFGNQGFVSRSEMRRVWYAMTSRAAPWEFASQKESQDEIDKVQTWIINQLRWDNRDDRDYFPSPEEVQKNTQGLFTMWAALGAVVPAPTRPNLRSRAEFDELAQQYKDEYGYGLGEGDLGDSWVKKLYRDHPNEASIFMRSTTKRLDPNGHDGFEEWLDEGNGIKNQDYDMRYKKYLNYDEYKSTWSDQRRLSKAWGEYNMILNGAYLSHTERQTEIQSFLRRQREDNPDINFNNSYYKKKELARIMSSVPESQRNEALRIWRNSYDVSGSEFMRLKYEVRDFEVQPWIEARNQEEILDVVRVAKNRGVNEIRFVETHLTAAEQVIYWNSKMADLTYMESRPYQEGEGYGGRGQQRLSYPDQKVREWNDYQGRISKLFALYPTLSGDPKPKTEYGKFVADQKTNYYSSLNSSFEEIRTLSDARQVAYEAKDWTTYNALKARLADANERQRALKNSVFEKYGDWSSVASDIKALMVISENEWANPKLAREQRQRWRRKVGSNPDVNPYFVAFGDDSDYLKMNTDMRKAYVLSLTSKLDLDKKDYDNDISPIRWEYLTEWQKSLLERNFPKAQVDVWKYKDSIWDNKEAKSYKGWTRYKRRSYGRKGGDEASIALDYAFNLMKQYSKRPDGAKAPAAYEEYINLPQDPAVKRQFLRAHPEVQEWIRMGPLSNMPVLERAIVTNIMVKYGKWEGEPKDSSEITEVAWARLQMQMWNKRSPYELAPEAYDAWVNMPTGVEKAQYLEQHPEIGDWLKSGPMSNMPDNLKDVVRDIMVRYGEWTTSQDPLGQTITEFYTLPSYARQPFLLAHPELTAYWSALRSPAEERMHKMQETYFSIVDPSARRMFLSAHPELQESFVTSRQRRYEKFLNQVAQYMGANPELFEQYLTRQTDVLTEMVRKFGELPFVQEQPKVKSKATTGKRALNRQAS